MPQINVLDGSGNPQTVETLPSVGQKVAAASLPVVLASDQGTVPVSLSGSLPVTGPLTDTQLRAAPVPSSYPQAGTASFISVATNATGATYNAFGALACKSLSVYNATGTALEFRRGGSGDTFVIPDGGQYVFTGLANASGMQVRRADTSNTPVTVKAEGLT